MAVAIVHLAHTASPNGAAAGSRGVAAAIASYRSIAT
jgi:hypothetical protein